VGFSKNLFWGLQVSRILPTSREPSEVAYGLVGLLNFGKTLRRKLDKIIVKIHANKAIRMVFRYKVPVVTSNFFVGIPGRAAENFVGVSRAPRVRPPSLFLSKILGTTPGGTSPSSRRSPPASRPRRENSRENPEDEIKHEKGEDEPKHA
jgi:hypothetical protein